MSRTLFACPACGQGLAYVRKGGSFAVLAGVAVAARTGTTAAFVVCPGCRRIQGIAGVRVVLLPRRLRGEGLRSRDTLLTN